MKDFRTLSLSLASIFVLMNPFVQSFAQEQGFALDGAGLPADLGSTCLKRQKNATGIRDGLRNKKVPNACREQIQKQYEACNMAGADTETGVDASAPAPTSNIRNGAQAQRDGLRIAATRNTAKSKLCAKAKENVKEKCGEIEKGLKQAQISNASDKARQLGAVPAGPNRASQIAAINRRYSDIDLDLESQRTETGKFREAAEGALDDNARCYGDVAQRDSYDADRAQEVIASANSDGPPPAEIEKTNVSALEEPGGPKKSEGIVSAVKDQIQSEGQNAVARTGVGAAFGEGSMAAGATRFVAGATTGVLGLGTAGVGMFLGSTSEAGNACDELYKDALSAHAAGCRVATRNTVQSLGSNP